MIGWGVVYPIGFAGGKAVNHTVLLYHDDRHSGRVI
jgi:hypothetical protein